LDVVSDGPIIRELREHEAEDENQNEERDGASRSPLPERLFLG
jgi:hypothetical protein